MLTKRQANMQRIGRMFTGASKRRSPEHYRKAQAAMITSRRAKKLAAGRAVLGLPPL